jgi:hypothetical protein|tara:strand:+ start:180 stop:581 length:402 start_codon:yes stop_codon:yes gene_type:complete
MSTGSFALQEAIYSRLNSDSNLTSTLGASIFDEVPHGTATPYVSIGYGSQTEFDTKSESGSTNTLNLHIWSEYKGAKECKQIMDRIHDLLHNHSLSVTGFNLINLRFEFSDILRDPDGVTRHGIMRFRAVMLG